MTGRVVKDFAKRLLARLDVSIRRAPDHFQLRIGRKSKKPLSVFQSEKLASRCQDLVFAQINLDKQGGSFATPKLQGEIDIALSGEPIAVPETGTWTWPAHLGNGVRTACIAHRTSKESKRIAVDFRSTEEKLFAGIFVSAIRHPLMSMFLMGKENGKAFAKGWVYDPDRQPRADHFRLNGQVADIILTQSQPGWETHIGPVFSHFSMKGDQHFAFFEAAIENSGPDREPIVIEYQPELSQPFNRCRFGYAVDRLPMPEGETFKRVSGNVNPFTFRLSGYSASLVLRNIVEHYLEKSVAALKNVLDWGCGCGRVSRHFADDAAATNWYGVDIDEIGIQWARENLPFGDFRRIKPLEKTPFPDNHFEFIFGISVFTHLREQDQLFWLQELVRILAPGGIVAVSIGGKTLRARLFTTDTDELAHDDITGYTDHGRSDAIEGSIADKEYYRSTFISEDYVRGIWSRYFNVLDIHPGLIGCRQDLVVLRKNE